MRSFMAHYGFYIDTIDEKEHRHHYRLTPQETRGENWSGESITAMRSPTFKFSQIISDESARNLWKAVH